MGKKNDVLESFQRLGRNIKRRIPPTMPNTHGRAQGKTLRLIEQNDGIRANELAILLDIRPSSLTQKLDKLEIDGNIKRIRDRRDARVVRIYITDEGREALEQRKKERQQIKQDFSDCLTEREKEIFCELCDRLSNNLERIREEEKALYAGVTILKKEKQENEELEDMEDNGKIG
ncbi:MarR family transcriptional regulator [Anaerovorax odorimutans]|uniref:MarR family transcriptional regulator n=1 Tax=Anaerovorax odorimutans TaxID=109327 RepID=UPI00040EDBE7|nr:MarR family transcriptional regulator [Anaerovorax odorimutans]